MTSDDIPVRLRSVVERWHDSGGSLVDQILAALGDTVPASTLGKVVTSYDETLREARAERDALAHVVEQASMLIATWNVNGARLSDLSRILHTAPAVSRTLHDAEVKAQALDEFAALVSTPSPGTGMDHWTTAHIVMAAQSRAAAIREEAK